MRGIDPGYEERIHTLIGDEVESKNIDENPIIDDTDAYDQNTEVVNPTLQRRLVPVCKPLPNSTLSSLLFYAPLALNFIYCLNNVDMQQN